MNLEAFVTSMMTINVKARLWHWMTSVANHHTTFENFLTQNEAFTDSFMESAMGNEMKLSFSAIGVDKAMVSEYSIDRAKADIKAYRQQVTTLKNDLSGSDATGAEELTTILDDVIELCSKTIYLLNLK